MRYFLHEDPGSLSDEEYFLRWEQLKWVLQKMGTYKAG